MIEVRNVEFSYDGEPALDGVSLFVPDGETIALMGANGAGKTTLLRLLADLDEPDAGSIDRDGVVGFAPENPADALFAETVREELAFFPRNRGIDVDAGVDRALDAMEIEHLREREPHTLSAGEQRRVSIAAVLAGDPAVVALDEPTSGLDRRGERRLGELLASLDATVVFSTHESDVAYEFADRVAVLADGELLRSGDPHDVLADEELLATADVRTPGLVEWARAEDSDRLPETLDAAVEMARGRR